MIEEFKRGQNPLVISPIHRDGKAFAQSLRASMKAEGMLGQEDHEVLTAVCAELGPRDLAEVLKYPFCTGEAEQIVLLQLEAKTSRDFGGNVWKFAEQADALGIKDIGSPAQRPSVQDALNELNKL